MSGPETEFEMNKRQLTDSLSQFYEAVQAEDIERAEYLLSIVQLLFKRMKAEVETNRHIEGNRR